MRALLINHPLENIRLYSTGPSLIALAWRFETPYGRKPQVRLFVAGFLNAVTSKLKQLEFRWNAEEQTWEKTVETSNPWTAIDYVVEALNATQLWEHLYYDQWRRFIDARRRYHPNDIYKLYRRVVEGAHHNGVIDPINFADKTNEYTQALDDLDRAILDGANQSVKLEAHTSKIVNDLIQRGRATRPDNTPTLPF